MVTATFLDPALYGMLASGSGAVPGDVNEGLPTVGTMQALAGTYAIILNPIPIPAAYLLVVYGVCRVVVVQPRYRSCRCDSA